VKDQVRAALVAEKAKRSAIKAASDLAYALYDGKVSRGAALDAFLAPASSRRTSLAPFTREAGPAELGGSHEIAARPSAQRRPVLLGGAAQPLRGRRADLEGTLPAREPLLAEVRDKVRADAFDNQKRMRFVEFGRT
jgi:peptidyl-prolyl cis-trans isomerase D